jgi:hypothetical protein
VEETRERYCCPFVVPHARISPKSGDISNA